MWVLFSGKVDPDDQVMSSESDDDEDDLASYFDRGSDSDLSEDECSLSYPQRENIHLRGTQIIHCSTNLICVN